MPFSLVYGWYSRPPQQNADTLLPVELRLAVMDYLDQPTVLALAASSRPWRAAAILHESYYLHIPLYICSFNAQARRPRAAPAFFRACGAVVEAVEARTPVSLEISVQNDGPSSHLSALERRIRLLRLWHMLPWAINRTVFALEIRGLAESDATISSMLNTPALSLKRLILRASFRREESTRRQQQGFPGIFGGFVPHLSIVELDEIPIDDLPLATFQSTTTVLLRRISVQHLRLHILFPHLRVLDVKLAKPSDLALLNLGSLPLLKHLRLEECDEVERTTPEHMSLLPQLSLVELLKFDTAVFTACYADMSDLLCVNVDIVSRRIFVGGYWVTLPLARIEVCNSQRRVAYESRFRLPNAMAALIRTPFLSLHQSRMGEILRVRGAASLPALETLVIVLSWPPQSLWPPQTDNVMDPLLFATLRLDFPSLRHVRLVRDNNSIQIPTVTLADMIIFGQVFLPLASPPTLSLMGVRWNEEVQSDSVLHNLFSIIDSPTV